MLGSSLYWAALTAQTQHWLSRDLALMRSSQWRGPVVKLKLPGQMRKLAPLCLISMASSGNLRSQQMPIPILQYLVSKTQTFYPRLKVQDSQQVIFPGMLMSKRCILSQVVCSSPWGLMTKAVLKSFWLAALRAMVPMVYMLYLADCSLMAFKVGEFEKSQANSMKQFLTYGELHISPRTETLAPPAPACWRAFEMNWMFCSLLATQRVCSMASLNLFIRYV